MTKTPKMPRLYHLLPIPWEAQESQSEWLLEQFDKQHLPEAKPGLEYAVDPYAQGECPQPRIEGWFLDGLAYEIPTCSLTGNATVYRRVMMEVYLEDYDKDSEDPDFWIYSSDTCARWPNPLMNHDLDVRAERHRVSELLETWALTWSGPPSIRVELNEVGGARTLYFDAENSQPGAPLD